MLFPPPPEGWQAVPGGRPRRAIAQSQGLMSMIFVGLHIGFGKVDFFIAMKEHFRIFRLLFFAAFILFSPPPSKVHAAQVTLAWEASTDPNIAGYKIYYGNGGGSYPTVVDVGNQTTCTIPNLAAGMTYHFAATAYDKSGQESGYSNEVVYNASSPCPFSLSPAANSFNSTGGTGTVGIAGQTGCAWTANSNVSWVIITSNSSGTGNGNLWYWVAANPKGTSRSGTLTIGGKVLTVTQAAASQ